MTEHDSALTREQRATLARRQTEASYIGHAGSVEKRTLANLVKRWIETGTASFMDDAVEYCELKDLPVTSVLRRHLSEAAYKRRGNKPSKAMREGMQDNAMRTIANLIYIGAPLKEAAGKAAHWLNGQALGYTLKASSLEKEYTAKYRTGDPSIEGTMHASWRESPNNEFDMDWRRLRESLPEPDDDELGNRRL